MADETVFAFKYVDGGSSASPAPSRAAGGASRPVDPADGVRPAGGATYSVAGAAAAGAARGEASVVQQLGRTLAGIPLFAAGHTLLGEIAGHLQTLLGVVAAGSRASAAAGAAGAARGGARVVSSSVAGAAGSAAGRAALPAPASSSTALSAGIARPVAGGAIAGLAGGTGTAAAGGAIVGLSATGIGLAVAAGLAINLAVMKAVNRQIEKVIATIRQWDQELLTSAQRLSAYNGQLAMSQARAEISQVLGDIRQAQQLGPMLSRYQNARTSQDMAAKRIETAIEKVKLEVMTPVAEIGSVLKGNIANAIETLTPLVTVHFRFMEFALNEWMKLNPIAKAAWEALKAQAEAGNPKVGADSDIMGIFFGGGFNGFNQTGPLQARPLLAPMNEAGIVPFKPVEINGGDLGGIR